jgi:hypothetical protein
MNNPETTTVNAVQVNPSPIQVETATLGMG